MNYKMGIVLVFLGICAVLFTNAACVNDDDKIKPLDPGRGDAFRRDD